MARRGDIFNTVGGANPNRTAFDLSYEVKTTADFAGLQPVQCDEVVPGDVWKMSVNSIIRMNPLAVPVMHGIKVSYHTFFIPYRLLWDDWENYVTGGVQGDDTHVIPKVMLGDSGAELPGSIWDYFGLPTDISLSAYRSAANALRPIDFPFAAYDFVYYEYYRDQNYCNVSTLGQYAGQSDMWRNIRFQVDNLGRQNVRWKSRNYRGTHTGTATNIPTLWTISTSNDVHRLNTQYYKKVIYMRNRRKDYFTSVLPDQQRGIAPAFPITGNVQLPLINQVAADLYATLQTPGQTGSPFTVNVRPASTSSPGQIGSAASQVGYLFAQQNNQFVDVPPQGSTLGITYADLVAHLKAQGNITGLTGVSVTELRDNVQLQKWLERAMRGGVRYTEWLKAMFGVHPRDDRLDRPEYIGGYKRDVQISEVLQTSQTTPNTSPNGASALGDYGGHGISVGAGYIGTYRVQEFGLIMTLMSIMPDEGYEDQLNRQWIKNSRYDFYNPLFAHLSEEGVYNAEIRYNCAATDSNIFGYQGIWNWMRFKSNMSTGKMRMSVNAGYGQWQLNRHWAVGTVPTMDHNFLISQQNWDPATGLGSKRCLAVPSEPAFIVNHRNQITAIRPMPWDAEPGMLDHF